MTYCERDHEEVERLLGELRNALRSAAGDPTADIASLARPFDGLAERLESHMQWEEETLFPMVEDAAPELARGVGVLLREQHERIRRFTAIAAKHVHEQQHRRTENGPSRAAELLEEVLRALQEHCTTEAPYVRMWLQQARSA